MEELLAVAGLLALFLRARKPEPKAPDVSTLPPAPAPTIVDYEPAPSPTPSPPAPVTWIPPQSEPLPWFAPQPVSPPPPANEPEAFPDSILARVLADKARGSNPWIRLKSERPEFDHIPVPIFSMTAISWPTQTQIGNLMQMAEQTNNFTDPGYLAALEQTIFGIVNPDAFNNSSNQNTTGDAA